MLTDEHLGTGEYHPEKYWNARARSSAGSTPKAVGGFKMTEDEYAATDAVQRRALNYLTGLTQLSGARVMELGCGVGRLAKWFSSKGSDYSGIDIAGEMLEIARRRCPNLSFHKVDSTRLPFESGTFDLVCSVTVLHHNTYAWQREMIDELVRVTKPGGFIVIMESIRTGAPRVPMPLTPTRFNLFPRYLEDWITGVEEGRSVRLVRMQLSRWSITRDCIAAVLEKASRSVGLKSASTSSAAKFLDRMLVKLGGRVDPYLMTLLPRKFARNAGLCFRKQ